MRSTSSGREKAAREASPTACIIDSQSVKSAEKGGARIDSHGFDAGKLIKGKKRHVLVDRRKAYNLLHGIVTAADVQDRDGGFDALLATLFGLFPFLGKCRLVRRQRLSGAGLSPRPGRHPARSRDRDRQAMSSDPGVKGFVVQPRRWVVERTIDILAQPLPPTGQSTEGRTSTATRSPSSSSRPFDSCSENSVILHKVSGRTLS